MTIRILTGDCRDVLKELPDASVQCCVTSPPYFGLRDYGVAGQIGLEQSPDDYVWQLVSVFREVRRVLRDDGTCWLNLGDSYATGGQRQTGRNDAGRDTPGGRGGSFRGGERIAIESHCGAKPKDLIGIPWLVAFALRADGWWLRSDIIWAKPNPMPESVRDRPTCAHEHIFLLAKRERYYYDQDAIRWAPTGRTDTISSFGNVPDRMDEDRKGAFTLDAAKGRNERNVWSIATAPYAEAHFATFPPELAERCIRAGSRPGDIVIDPFAGAFTTALVADRLQRHAIGIELNPTYCDMARRRIEADAGMFAECVT